MYVLFHRAYYIVCYSFRKKKKKETNKIVKIDEREFLKKKKIVYLVNRYNNGSIKEVSRIR